MSQTIWTTGSFDDANQGDLALVDAFCQQYFVNVQNVTLICEHPERHQHHAAVDRPPLALGRRFWAGYTARQAWLRKANSHRSIHGDLTVGLGGLLGHIAAHNRMRLAEWRLLSSMSHRFLYFFGDVGDGFRRDKVARSIVQFWNQQDACIAVRSVEAADELSAVGYRGPIHVGLDPVLYDRWQRDFKAGSNDTADAPPTIAIAPCAGHDRLWATWRHFGKSALALGYHVAWVATSDVDVDVCHALMMEINASERHSHHNLHRQQVIQGEACETAIRCASAVVASRYHAAIFALAANVPVIGVPYGAKLDRLFRLLSLDDWYLTGQCDRGVVAERLRQAVELSESQVKPAVRQQLMERHAESLESVRKFVQDGLRSGACCA